MYLLEILFVNKPRVVSFVGYGTQKSKNCVWNIIQISYFMSSLAELWSHPPLCKEMTTAPLPDLILDVNVLVKGELSRQRDVDDDSGAPHVQRAVEAALFQHVRVENLTGAHAPGAFCNLCLASPRTSNMAALRRLVRRD
jgi:hypothetical protein